MSVYVRDVKERRLELSIANLVCIIMHGMRDPEVNRSKAKFARLSDALPAGRGMMGVHVDMTVYRLLVVRHLQSTHLNCAFVLCRFTCTLTIGVPCTVCVCVRDVRDLVLLRVVPVLLTAPTTYATVLITCHICALQLHVRPISNF